MKIKDVLDYYKTAANFTKETGFTWTNISYWKQRGYVPAEMQLRLQEMTKGELKASAKDLPTGNSGGVASKAIRKKNKEK